MRAVLSAAMLVLCLSPVALAQVPVSTVTVTAQPVNQGQKFVGRIEAVDHVDIKARVTGFLQERLFNEGDLVKEGQPLYRIEKDQFEAAVQQAEGALVRAQAQLANAKVQRQRAEELVKTSATSVATRDERVAAEKTAEGATIAAQADLRAAKINLAYTDILAPITGRIGRSSVTRGNVVGPDSGVLTTIVSTDPMYVVFPVSQREFLKIQKQDNTTNREDFKIVLQFSDGSLYDSTGKINFVDVKVDRATDSVIVRASIANPQSKLFDGQLVQVSVETEKPQEKVLVPQAALIADQRGTYVFAVVDGKAVEKRLKVGAPLGTNVIVEDGLAAGTQVIVEGLRNVKPGAEVLASPVQNPISGM
jgi:membrane fusion protein (multidrug efflux system)